MSDIDIDSISTPQSRAIKALCARSVTLKDPYLAVVAGEFERTYRLMWKARKALIEMQQAIDEALKVPE